MPAPDKLAELCELVKALPSLVAGRGYPGGKDQYTAAMNRACELAQELTPGGPNP